MERMLVVVFDNESKAYEGSKALTQLDSEGSISAHAKAVIKKNADGTVSVMQTGDDLPIRTMGGTAVGALIGLLGGPIGLGASAAAGAVTGAIMDFHRSGVNVDFLNEASAKLTPGKWAIVSDISEEWVTPARFQNGSIKWHRISRLRGRTSKASSAREKWRQCKLILLSLKAEKVSVDD